MRLGMLPIVVSGKPLASRAASLSAFDGAVYDLPLPAQLHARQPRSASGSLESA
jgi:hypothetical protein